MNEFQNRIAKLQAGFAAEDIQLMVISASDQMRYLTGWLEHGHERLIALLVPASGEPVFVVPAMNVPQASKNQAGIEQIIGWTDEIGSEAVLASLFDKFQLSGSSPRILIDDELAASHLLTIQSLLPNGKYFAAGSHLAAQRQIKSDEEIISLTAAAHLIDEIFEEAVEILRTGISEIDVQQYLLDCFKRKKTSPSFNPLVCFGENTAVPHHSSGERTLKPGDMIILDIGCTSEFYASDITRTIAFGEPADPDASSVYSIVSKAHHDARASIKPGITAESIDSAARNEITSAGFGEYFIHRTGHGIGISTHEPPYIVQGNKTLITSGMCFSVEPGIYIPGRFGVRIENIVTVTAAGVLSLNAEPEIDLRILPVK